MGQALRHPGYSLVQEYLGYEQGVGLRQEDVGGVISAMVGITDRHNRIAGNVVLQLRKPLKQPWQVFGQGMKVRVESEIGEARYGPDVMALCDGMDREPLYREGPSAIVELLSPATESDVRQGKFRLDRTIPVLEHDILVAPGVPQVEVFACDEAWKPDILFRPFCGDAVDVCGGRTRLTVDDN